MKRNKQDKPVLIILWKINLTKYCYCTYKKNTCWAAKVIKSTRRIRIFILELAACWAGALLFELMPQTRLLSIATFENKLTWRMSMCVTGIHVPTLGGFFGVPATTSVLWEQYPWLVPADMYWYEYRTLNLENPGIDPGISRMRSGRSNIWANSSCSVWEEIDRLI